MISLTAWYLVFIAVMALFGFLAVWPKGSPRAALLVGLGCALFAAYVMVTDTMGRAKPLWAEHRNVSEATVRYFEVHPGAGIFVLLETETFPRWYRMEWDETHAQQLMGAADAAGEEGRGVVMENPFERSLEERGDPIFHPAPWPRLPDKVPNE